MSDARGFGVAAGLDSDVAVELAGRCEELGYTSLWSNDHPAASGIETLADFARGSEATKLGVAVLALDRNDPADINAKIEECGLERGRLLIGVGAGFSKKPLTRMREAHDELREAIPGVKLILAAMGPKMCALAGSHYDGAFFNWMTPGFAADARLKVEEGGGGRRPRGASGLRLRPHLSWRRRRDPPRQGGGLLPRPPRRLPQPLRPPRRAARLRRRRRRAGRGRRSRHRRLRGPRHGRGPRPGERQLRGDGPSGNGRSAAVARSGDAACSKRAQRASSKAAPRPFSRPRQRPCCPLCGPYWFGSGLPALKANQSQKAAVTSMVVTTKTRSTPPMPLPWVRWRVSV